jgi:hypothetical protein
METITTAKQLLDAALKQVESPSIRAWVEKQRDIWERLGAQPILDNPKSGATNVCRLVTLIMIEAIGL